MQEFEQGYVMFGEIKIAIAIDKNKNFWFCANDIAINLGYKFHYDAVKKHVNAEDTKQIKNIQNRSEHPNKLYLNFSGMTCLILRSKLTIAQGFTNWLFNVLNPAVNDYKIYCLHKENKKKSCQIVQKLGHLRTLKDDYNRLSVIQHYTQQVMIYAILMYNINKEYTNSHENIPNDESRKYKLCISDDSKIIEQLKVMNNGDVILLDMSNEINDKLQVYMHIKILLLDYRQNDGEYLCDRKVIEDVFNKVKNNDKKCELIYEKANKKLMKKKKKTDKFINYEISFLERYIEKNSTESNINEPVINNISKEDENTSDKKKKLTAFCKNQWCRELKKKRIDDYCLHCSANMFPEKKISNNYGRKELQVVTEIMNYFPDVDWVHNKQIVDGCSTRRPDLFLDLGSHAMFIEVDENRHDSYDCICENKRLMELSRDIGHRNMLMIRFNPDGYVNLKGEKISSCWNRNNKTGLLQLVNQKDWNARINTLKEQIRYWMDNVPEKNVEIIQLFY
jgi:prophage antirepressor-like protein